MLKIKSATILSFFAAICFLAAYFVHKSNMNLILGCAWVCLGCSFGCIWLNSLKKDAE